MGEPELTTTTTPDPRYTTPAPPPPPTEPPTTTTTIDLYDGVERKYDIKREEEEMGPYSFEQYVEHYGGNEEMANYYWQIGDPVTTPPPKTTPVPLPPPEDSIHPDGTQARKFDVRRKKGE